MPLIKVSSPDKKVTKLISANDLETLRAKSEEKLAFRIRKFVREKDGIEIDDNEVLVELMQLEKELWVIAIEFEHKKLNSVKVSLFNQSKYSSFDAMSINSLKKLVESQHKVQIEKFVRKIDGLEIDEDEILLELIKKQDEDESWLIALQFDEQYEPELFKFGKYEANSILRNNHTKNDSGFDQDEEANYFFDEYDSVEKNIKELKINEPVKKTPSNETVELDRKKNELLEKVRMEKHKQQEKSKRLKEIEELSDTLAKETKVNEKLDQEFQTKVTLQKNKSILRTAELDEKKNELEERLKNEQIKREKKLKDLEEIKTLSTTLAREKSEVERLNEEYRKKLFSVQATREASKTDLANAELKLEELKIKQAKIANIFFDLKEAEKVDICFMLDATGSMAPYIAEAKSVIHRIVDKLQERFKDFELRASFVGYRDHSDGAKRVTVFDFSEKKDAFKTFVSSVEATGGADQCEDVFGGLEEVAKLNWTNPTRVLFHIGDAPCHGLRFHSGASDDYPSGDPRGLIITDLLKNLITKNIFYYFAEVNKSTMKMIEEFNNELISMNGNRINVLKLSSVDGLTELVTKSIVTSITETKTLSMHSTRGKTLKNIKVDPSPINWSQSLMKKFKAKFYSAKYDGDLTSIKDNSILFEEKNVEIWMSRQPFAKGGMRFAYAGFLSDDKLKKIVLKESIFRDIEYNTMTCHKEILENQVLASYLAKTFFNLIKTEKSIKFIDVNLIHLVDEGNYYSIEDFIEGNFVKWCNNAGFVDEDIYSCTLDAFAHWTYQATNEYLIVTDLQGMIVDNKDYILTDPAISCPESPYRFSASNLGTKGVQKFFQSHQCNHICKYLKLKKHIYQKLSDREFKPSMTRIR